jgi:Flp pilus assembly protein TadG
MRGRFLRRFLRSERGTATILAIFFLLIMLVMGGLAVDFNRAISDRTHLQVTADTAAHAALYTRAENSSADAKRVALKTIENMLPEAGFGRDAVLDSDVEFGLWDPVNRKFTRLDTASNAVRVTAQMTQERGNPSRNILLNIIGADTFDVAAVSVYTTYSPPCFTEGFVAEEVVDIQSNNTFRDGFCIHSNSHVSLNQNNFFEPGTVVSMPDTDDLDIAASGFEKNEGLRAALRKGKYRMRLLDRLPDMIDGFWSGEPTYLPEYVHAGAVFDVTPTGDTDSTAGKGKGGNKKGKSFSPIDFEPNAVNRFGCDNTGKTTLSAGTYSSFLLITDCEIQFAQGVQLQDVTIATTSTSQKSLTTPSDLYIGRDDDCAEGGGAALLTLGGFHAAAKLNVFGGQILAMGDIDFAANADGIEGASFVSGGRIDGTSNMEMGFCQNRGMENAYRMPYFRMAM